MYQPRILALTLTEDSVLHKPSPRVTFPLSEQDKHLIADMLYSIQGKQLKTAGAPWDSAAGMAANQWGFSKAIFLFCPNKEKDVEVIINPQYRPIASPNDVIEEELAWEGCFSLPKQRGLIRRFKAIHVEYQNEEGEYIHKDLFDWEARVFQHETDHLMGYLFDDPRIEKCLQKQIIVPE